MIPAHRPPNFSWVVDGVLAACAIPSQTSHFQYLRNHGINHLYNLTEWKTPKQFLPAGLKNKHMAIEEFCSPSVQQMHQFATFVEKARKKKEAVAVHCYWGLGRTGTMLAAYLVQAEGMAPGTAICQVRQLRPYSIETEEQEDAVIDYAAYLHSLKPPTVADEVQEEEEASVSSSSADSSSSTVSEPENTPS